MLLSIFRNLGDDTNLMAQGNCPMTVKENFILVTPLDLHIFSAFPDGLLLSLTIPYSCTEQLMNIYI